mmetsp:Transcript_2342/g.6534  ORF Transcript_2342/g.6534 Transcript_2342/m.6534 type:complete len:453 (-) Transcript_2342:568-1926(-)
MVVQLVVQDGDGSKGGVQPHDRQVLQSLAGALQPGLVDLPDVVGRRPVAGQPVGVVAKGVVEGLLHLVHDHAALGPHGRLQIVPHLSAKVSLQRRDLLLCAGVPVKERAAKLRHGVGLSFAQQFPDFGPQVVPGIVEEAPQGLTQLVAHLLPKRVLQAGQVLPALLFFHQRDLLLEARLLLAVPPATRVAAKESHLRLVREAAKGLLPEARYVRREVRGRGRVRRQDLVERSPEGGEGELAVGGEVLDVQVLRRGDHLVLQHAQLALRDLAVVAFALVAKGGDGGGEGIRYGAAKLRGRGGSLRQVVAQGLDRRQELRVLNVGDLVAAARREHLHLGRDVNVLVVPHGLPDALGEHLEPVCGNVGEVIRPPQRVRACAVVDAPAQLLRRALERLGLVWLGGKRHKVEVKELPRRLALVRPPLGDLLPDGLQVRPQRPRQTVKGRPDVVPDDE